MLTFNVCGVRIVWGANGPQQAYRNFFCLPPLGAFGWLVVESQNSKGFTPLFGKVRYGLDSLLS